jgi:hypothetical protein
MLLIPKKLYHTIVFLAVYYISMYILCFSVKHLRTTLLNEVLYKSYIIIIIIIRIIYINSRFYKIIPYEM